jgi:ubiquinone/menaquinone biosynthesis C-methylase UbiE
MREVRMRVMDAIHGQFLIGRRARVLSGHVATLLPSRASVLDVGCGDGDIARRIMETRPDISIHGIDVLVRPETAIPVDEFDGSHFPFADHTFDVVTFVDVLHHTDDPTALLAEASRVARKSVVIKDHLVRGVLARPTLRLMDMVGNVRHSVALPFNYLTYPEWETAFAAARLAIVRRENRLSIYPWPATLVFDRKLHFIAELTVPQSR